MISDATLAKAVAAGHITAEQVQRLREIEGAGGEVPVSPDDEKLRFITGFADIFVTIGIGLFLYASSFFAGLILSPGVSWITVAVLSWMLAEFFTRRRRLAFPSIVLLLTFIIPSFLTLAFFLGPFFPDLPFSLLSITGIKANYAGWSLAALITAALAALHYRRFHVPITIAAGAGALCIIPTTLAANLLPQGSALLPIVLLACGLLVFTLAMRFDMSDPARETRRTDIAFWLHLLAAPLIVHSLIRGILGVGGFQQPDMRQSLLILTIFLVLGLIAIVIDRRAILVAGLTYAGIAFGSLIKQSGLGNMVVPATLLALGVFVLLLSAFWQPLRRGALGGLPPRLTRFLPHPLSVGP